MYTRLRNHILFWVVYIIFKTYLNVSADEPIVWLALWNLVLMQLTFLLVKIPLVYFCFFVTDKYLESNWKIWKVIAVLGLGFLMGVSGMTILNHQVVLPLIFSREANSPMFAPSSLVYHFFMLSFIVGVALSIRLFRRQYKLKLHEAELEKEKKETELKYLKSQINPHFLFNTLNNIYSLARKGSEHTAESVLKLSALMRFMLYEASGKEILLTDELRIIEDYIELEKLRYTSRLKVIFIKEIDNPDQRIAPLLLIHFVENAFKHGAGESREGIEIQIKIQLKDSLLTAEFINPIGADVGLNSNVQIGMKNIQRQLNLLYPAHQLLVNKGNNRFHVTLTIPL
jgi:two-component system LytT family sensor kinase